MKKKYIVKNKYDFNNMIREEKYIKNKYFIIYYKDNNLEYDRFGISVGKKLGNAVLRNKYKRRIRNILDIYKKEYVNKKDYIIILKNRALDLEFTELKQYLIDLLKGEKNDKKK